MSHLWPDPAPPSNAIPYMHALCNRSYSLTRIPRTQDGTTKRSRRCLRGILHRGVDGGRHQERNKESFTVYERQSDDGERHSPLFSLPVGEVEGLTFPMKMVMFNNDLYGSREDVVAGDEDERVGYNQV